MSNEKQKVAFSSVVAAVFLTVIKIIVGVLSGSLGIMSEAAHSALDLVAAVVTFFAVKFADKPADSDHTYGHGKVESFSALIETLLLLGTCAWIIYEAVERLFFGKGIVVSNTTWGLVIMGISIIVNISRSRALKKVAKKYGSQALEADALHFDSDIWSSYVVIAGLVCVWLGNKLNIPALSYGDPVAALGVSLLVIVVSVKLGKKTIEVLLDTAPEGMVDAITEGVKEIQGVLEVNKVRVRPSGASYFIDINIGLNRNESHRVVHTIVHNTREKVQSIYPNSDIVISTYPVDVEGAADREVYLTVKKVVDRFPVCTNIHNINIYEVEGEKHIALHLEVKENLSLKESHDLSHVIGGLIQQELEDVKDVSVNFESSNQRHMVAEDVTDRNNEMIRNIESLINTSPDKVNCHDIKIYSKEGKFALFLHCEVKHDFDTRKLEKLSGYISNKIRNNVKNVENIHIHIEPMGE